MQVIPSIDLEGGRSRLVSWPGAATGEGTPTDRPERIAASFVARGARLIHVVDFDGARAGRPGNLEAIGRIASRVAAPLQVAGGVEGPDEIRLVFAAGATRVVVGMGIADWPQRLAECLAVAGDWLAVGLDARPARLAEYPWRRAVRPTLPGLVAELVAAGIRRFVLSHGEGVPDPATLTALSGVTDAEILIAGGITELDGIRRLRDSGAAGLIIGEPLLSGALDFSAALEAAA